MTGVVVSLQSHRRKREQPSAPNCLCRDAYACYPHRLAEAARILRVDLAAARDEGRLTVNRFAGTVDAVLPVLEAIVAECLPDDERTVR